MLTDRRALIEREITKQKQLCGVMYKDLIIGSDSPAAPHAYEAARTVLADMLADLAIVEQMIVDGHK